MVVPVKRHGLFFKSAVPNFHAFMHTSDRAFLQFSAHYLSENYLPKILRCLEEMSEEQVWWRPNAESNSLGNLVLHLCGNVRQWIISGVGGQADTRERQTEFDEMGPMPVEVLAHKVKTTLNEACNVILNTEPGILQEPRSIQGNEVTVMEAIYHAVEHFSMHTGQIIYITKLHQGKDLAFYKVTDDGKAYPQW